MSEESTSSQQRAFLLIEPSEYNLIILVLRRLFLCLLLLFLMGLGALAMWMDTDRRYSGFFLALIAFSGTLAVVRRGTHLHDSDNMFTDDDDILNTYLHSPTESPKHSQSAYRHQHSHPRGPPPQFSEEDPEPPDPSAHAALHHAEHCHPGWLPPPPPYHMACPEPPPAYFDIVPNLMDQNMPSTSQQSPALADVIFHEGEASAASTSSVIEVDAVVSVQSTLEGNAGTQTHEAQVIIDGMDASTSTQAAINEQTVAGANSC